MTTAADIRAEIDAITSRIDELAQKREALLDDWAPLACPFKVGAVVPVGSYAHRGKKAIIDRIGWTDANDPRWRVWGRLVKADGKPGLVEVDWCGDNNDLAALREKIRQQEEELTSLRKDQS